MAGNKAAVSVGVGGCLLLFVLVVLRIVSLVIAGVDFFGGHDHIVLDILLVLFLW